MTRRAFLAIAAAITATSAGVLAVADHVRPDSLAWHLRRFEGFGRTPLARLQAHYGWLHVDPAAFDSYLSVYQRFFGRLSRLSIPAGDFYTRFLLSTDFFARLATDPAFREPVRYTGFYHPAESPCYNPLAQSPPSDAELAKPASRSRS